MVQGKSDRQIGYIAVSNEHRSWATNAQTKGVGNPNSTLQHKTLKIAIKYDIIRTNNPTRHNKHVIFDKKATTRKRNAITTGPNENKNIQKTNTTKIHILQY